MGLGRLLLGSICFSSVALLLPLSLASLVPLQCCSGSLCFVDVFRLFLAHISVVCVFLSRRRCGWYGLVKFVVLVSSHSPFCVLLHVLWLLLRLLLHIWFRIVYIAMSASPVHILMFVFHFRPIPRAVSVAHTYGSGFQVLLHLFYFLLCSLRFLIFPGMVLFSVCLRIYIFGVPPSERVI